MWIDWKGCAYLTVIALWSLVKNKLVNPEHIVCEFGKGWPSKIVLVDPRLKCKYVLEHSLCHVGGCKFKKANLKNKIFFSTTAFYNMNSFFNLKSFENI